MKGEVKLQENGFMGRSPRLLMASGLWGFGLYTELKEPLLANHINHTIVQNI